MSQTQPSPGGRYDGTVGVFFTAHYAVDQREWNLIREFGNRYHPLAGYYRSDDPAVLRQQLQWMRRAGIDLIVYNAFSTQQWTLKDLPNDPTLPLLLAELAHQEGEARRLQFCFSLEAYLSNPTVEEYDAGLRYLRENVSDHPAYYRYHGQPLVVTIHNGENLAIHEVEYRNTCFALRRMRAFYTDAWSYVQHYPQFLHKEWMPASPGISAFLEFAYIAKYVKKIPSPDYAEIQRTAPQADREDGAYYRRQLTRAREANPEIIYLSGWNDWQFGLQIEPAVEYGCFYLDLTAEVLGRQDETRPYRDAAAAGATPG